MPEETRTFYCICQDGCEFETMTKEQIITAINECTGVVPSDIDEAFITHMKTINDNSSVYYWQGTGAELNQYVTEAGISQPTALFPYIYESEDGDTTIFYVKNMNTGNLIFYSVLPYFSSTTDGTSGADIIGATPLVSGGASTVQSILEYLKSESDNKLPKAGGALSGALYTQSIIPAATSNIQALLGMSSREYKESHVVDMYFTSTTAYTTNSPTLSRDDNNRVRISTSLRKFKTNIKDITEADAGKVMQLKPRSFKGKQEGIDDHQQYGFVAEEVEQVLPWLCTRDKEGNLTGVAYDRVAAVLLKEIQLMRAEIDELKSKLK